MNLSLPTCWKTLVLSHLKGSRPWSLSIVQKCTCSLVIWKKKREGKEMASCVKRKAESRVGTEENDGIHWRSKVIWELWRGFPLFELSKFRVFVLTDLPCSCSTRFLFSCCEESSCLGEISDFLVFSCKCTGIKQGAAWWYYVRVFLRNRVEWTVLIPDYSLIGLTDYQQRRVEAKARIGDISLLPPEVIRLIIRRLDCSTCVCVRSTCSEFSKVCPKVTLSYAFALIQV